MSKKKQASTNAIQTDCIEINLNQLIVDQDLQSRVEIDQALVNEYAEEMGRGAQFPPIIVFSDGSKYRLVDGFHRVLAAKAAGLTTIVADVRTGSKGGTEKWGAANSPHIWDPSRYYRV